MAEYFGTFVPPCLHFCPHLGKMVAQVGKSSGAISNPHSPLLLPTYQVNSSWCHWSNCSLEMFMDPNSHQPLPAKPIVFHEHLEGTTAYSDGGSTLLVASLWHLDQASQHGAPDLCRNVQKEFLRFIKGRQSPEEWEKGKAAAQVIVKFTAMHICHFSCKAGKKLYFNNLLGDLSLYYFCFHPVMAPPGFMCAELKVPVQ